MRDKVQNLSVDAGWDTASSTAAVIITGESSAAKSTTVSTLYHLESTCSL